MNSVHTKVAAISEQFDTCGYAIAEGLADAKCLEMLRPLYDGIIDGSIPCPTADRKLGGLTTQVVMPHLHFPELEANSAVKAASKIVARNQDTDDPELVFSMMIYKPGGHPHETPWHTDVSYAGVPTAPIGAAVPNNTVMTFWLALDDVDEDMGCMEFIPGRQEQPMPEHYVYSGEPTADDRLLAIRNPEKALDLDEAKKCPLKAGSATIHGYNTPHFTAPNRSDRGRRAFIFAFNHPQALRRVGRALSDTGS